MFEDDFEKGLSDAWEIVSGNPIVVNGTLSADQDTWLLVGDPSWDNYSVEFTTDLSYGWTKQNFNALGVLATSIDSMYVFRWAEYDSGCFIIENGDWNEVPQAEFTPKQGEKTFRVTIENGLFTVYLNGVKQTSFFDNRYSKGRITLKLFANNAIDNFKVREIID